ncbi:MAG TPA: methyltransferase, FxLD system [Streptosporangiaceae bacterium]|nr:methyltransferase, FxLD system [Streptosporangiaceae bacterium]
MNDELARMRERLATLVVTARRIGSERVAAALYAVPRHLFLPEQPPEAAYRDDAIVTKRDETGQPISSSSQPAIMAVMLDQLDLAPGHRVLEIGAGTGYNAALISHIVGPSGQVTSVDIDPELVATAREHLARAGFGDVAVVCADGAGGDPGHAPYDRVIATVGVSDLAPAWLEQTAPQARIVVPLDVRGTQLSIAFERADPAVPGSPWTSRSLAPCGFMRMRGSLAGPERVVLLAPGLSLLLPDGTPEVNVEALTEMLAGPPTPHPTEVRAESAQVFWGLGLWLAAREPRSCRLNEERPAGRRSAPGSRLTHAPLRGPHWRSTLGLLDGDGLAIVTSGAGGDRSGQLTLAAAGFGSRGADLAADLAAHIQAWGDAGRPGIGGLHVDAYPRARAGDPADRPQRPGDALIMERPGTWFAVYHD